MRSAPDRLVAPEACAGLTALMRAATEQLAAAHAASVPDGAGPETERCLWRLVAIARAIEQLLFGAEGERSRDAAAESMASLSQSFSFSYSEMLSGDVPMPAGLHAPGPDCGHAAPASPPESTALDPLAGAS